MSYKTKIKILNKQYNIQYTILLFYTRIIFTSTNEFKYIYLDTWANEHCVFYGEKYEYEIKHSFSMSEHKAQTV